MKAEYKAYSITLRGAVAMGTGVMIGAGIFALTGQIADLAGPWFRLSFVAGAIVTSFGAYTYAFAGIGVGGEIRSASGLRTRRRGVEKVDVRRY